VNGETYKLVCECGRELEIPCDGPHVCPHCQTALVIAWRAATKETSIDARDTPKATQGASVA
jgi:hypothetical protein